MLSLRCSLLSSFSNIVTPFHHSFRAETSAKEPILFVFSANRIMLILFNMLSGRPFLLYRVLLFRRNPGWIWLLYCVLLFKLGYSLSEVRKWKSHNNALCAFYWQLGIRNWKEASQAPRSSLYCGKDNRWPHSAAREKSWKFYKHWRRRWLWQVYQAMLSKAKLRLGIQVGRDLLLG